jgi:hypothetical protein
MSFLDRFTKKEIKVDKDIVSTVGTSGFFSLYDGTAYNPDSISLDVYKKIANHYQVKDSLAIMSYSIQQIDWFIQSDNEEAKKVVSYAMEKIWNRLIRSVAKSFKFGYSPMVKVFTLEEIDGKEYIIYSKIRDVDPGDCQAITDKFGNFNGFWYRKGQGAFEAQVKPDYAFWYTSDMENGNLYGESMLKNIYKPWYYSEKIHQFANRYYERFGEPLVVGRAPSSGKVMKSDGSTTNAQDLMNSIIASIRSHSSVQLPSDKDPESKDYLYDLKYLESQMRGFDFDNYLNRLDTEITKGLFVPELMFKSGSGGSFALGSAQIQAFYTTLMGIMDNIQDYINLYILPQLIEYNFGKNIEVRFNYQPLSVDAKKNIQDIILAMMNLNKLKVDIKQLEERSGFKLTEETPPTAIVTKADVKKDIKANNKELSDKILEEVINLDKKRELQEKLDEVESIKNRLKEAFDE